MVRAAVPYACHCPNPTNQNKIKLGNGTRSPKLDTGVELMSRRLRFNYTSVGSRPGSLVV